MTDEMESEMNDEFEEITSEEVDRVLEALEKLTASATSENIRTYLEEASDSIYELIYSDSEDDVDEAEMLDDGITEEAA